MCRCCYRCCCAAARFASSSSSSSSAPTTRRGLAFLAVPSWGLDNVVIVLVGIASSRFPRTSSSCANSPRSPPRRGGLPLLLPPSLILKKPRHFDRKPSPRHFCDYPRRSSRRASYNIHPLSRFRWRFTNSACRCYPEATRSQPSFRHHPASLALALPLSRPAHPRIYFFARGNYFWCLFPRFVNIHSLTLSIHLSFSLSLSRPFVIVYRTMFTLRCDYSLSRAKIVQTRLAISRSRF